MGRAGSVTVDDGDARLGRPPSGLLTRPSHVERCPADFEGQINAFRATAVTIVLASQAMTQGAQRYLECHADLWTTLLAIDLPSDIISLGGWRFCLQRVEKTDP